MSDIFEKLKDVKTRSELDAMRVEVVEAMQADGTKQTFESVQDAFIKAKNRVRRNGGWWR